MYKFSALVNGNVWLVLRTDDDLKTVTDYAASYEKQYPQESMKIEKTEILWSKVVN